MEIVFVSSDKDEAAFKEYYGSMPWLALPYSDRAKKGELSSKFKVKGIPTLVFVDETGELLTTNGRGVVMADPEADTYPFTPTSLKDELSNLKYHNAAGESVSVQEVLNKDVIMLYFSAHWCPPCKKFTPMLIEAYKKLKAAGKSVECVFISSDHSAEEYKDYAASMPWLGSGFKSKAAEKLSDRFEVEGIPTLVTIDGKTLKTIATNCVAALYSDPKLEDFPWARKPFSSLSAIADIINDKPVALAMVDQLPDGSNIVKKLQPQISAFVETLKGEDPVIFAYAEKSDPITPRVREVFNLSESCQFVIINIPSGEKYVGEGSVSDGFLPLAQKFIKKEIKGTPLK